jgi:hypothetical protein
MRPPPRTRLTVPADLAQDITAVSEIVGLPPRYVLQLAVRYALRNREVAFPWPDAIRIVPLPRDATLDPRR